MRYPQGPFCNVTQHTQHILPDVAHFCPTVLHCTPPGVLAPEELDWLVAQPHKQLALGQALSRIVAAADVDPMTRTRLDDMLTRYIYAVRLPRPIGHDSVVLA